jgi:hypothetical protein
LKNHKDRFLMAIAAAVMLGGCQASGVTPTKVASHSVNLEEMSGTFECETTGATITISGDDSGTTVTKLTKLDLIKAAAEEGFPADAVTNWKLKIKNGYVQPDYRYVTADVRKMMKDVKPLKIKSDGKTLSWGVDVDIKEKSVTVISKTDAYLNLATGEHKGVSDVSSTGRSGPMHVVVVSFGKCGPLQQS